MDNISEDDQVPPKLPMKRKSTLSTKSIMAIYDEQMEQILSPDSQVEIKLNEGDQPIYDCADASNKIRKERPRSMPIETQDNYDSVTYAIQNQSTDPSRVTGAQEQKRPIPKPRPRTVFLRTESADQLYRPRTKSAENLLKNNPAIDRVVRTGTENGAPPVPLKRAQLYRSQERIGNNNGFTSENHQKESKF